MPIVRRILSSLAVAPLLAACAGVPDTGPDNAAASRHLVLTRSLEIPPGGATVRLQYGQPVARNGVQETDPHCIFEIDTVSEAAQQVRPDRFPITAIQRKVETFSGMPAPIWHGFGAGLGRNDGPSQVYYITEFRLHSATQPGVRVLTCQSNQNAAGIGIPRHLTPAEIRQALGDYFRLEPAR